MNKDDETTRIVSRKNSQAELTETIEMATKNFKLSNDDEHTRIFRSGVNQSENADKNDEYTVGWLVVTSGNGRGKSFTIGYGVNSIGRSPTERVSLDFGDSEISRSRHALLTFDPKGRKFYLQNGDGVNLTYLSDNPVLHATELFGNEKITLGNTELCFIPFCGKNFDW